MTSVSDGGTEEKTVLKPKTILNHVTESEARIWNKGGISDLHEDIPSSHLSDLGYRIIRHGNAVKKIHDYFGKLEPRKCCMSLATCKTTFNNVRLVRNDGRDSGIEEGAMMKTPLDPSVPVVELSDEELHVFRYAFMCASFPVLGAPEPPSALSPSPTLSCDEGIRFKYTGILSVSRPNTPYSLHDSGVEEQDDMSIVPAETLYELLRRAFKLSTDKFYQYEQFICEKYDKRSPQKILAEELVGQLAALENNSNPFYNPHDFTTRHGYDIWHRHQFNQIAELMKKFWHSSYPPPMINYVTHLQMVHQDYRLLMEKLIRYESPYRHGDELHATGPMSPLSSASQRMLKEFGLRYGIGELYRKIVYLHYLSHHFDPTVWFIQHTHAVLAAILDLLSSFSLVRKEHEIFKDSIETLESRTSSTLCKMKSVFPANRPSDGIESLIDLISKTLQARSYIEIEKSDVLKDYLLIQIQTIFPTCYTEHKMVVMSEMKETDTELNPTLMNMMIGKVRDEVLDYKMNYQTTFEKFFNIVEIASQALYSLLMDDVLTLCQNRQGKPRNMQINRLMLALGYRLNQLDMDWSAYIPADAQIWREIFLKEEIHWTKVLKIRMQEMVLMAIGLDKYDTDEVNDVGPISQVSSSISSRRRDRSISTKSLTPSVNSAFSSLMSSYHSTPVHTINRLSVNSDKMHPTIPESNGRSVVIPQTSSLRRPKEDQKLSQKEHDLKKIDIPEKHVVYSGRKNYFDGETRSLLEFEEEEDDCYLHVRHGNSLPDIVSKSYDHHLTPSRSFINQLQGLDINPLNDPHSVNSCDISRKPTQGVDLTNSTANSTANNPLVCDKENINVENKDLEKNNLVAFPEPNVINSHNQKEEAHLHNDEDKDSLAGEFSDGSGTITDHLEHVESGSERSESPDVNFSFPQLSEVALMDKKPFNVSLTEADPLVTDSTKSNIGSSIKSVGSAFTGTNSLSPTVSQGLPPYQRTISSDTSQSKESESTKATVNKSPTFKFNMTAILPVSSSVIDLIVILQRLVGMGSVFCQTFCSFSSRRQKKEGLEESISSDNSVEFSFDLIAKTSRQTLYENLFDGLCNTLTLYADNILCMDLCGTTKSLARKLVGTQLLEHLDVQSKSKLIWGCRHDLNNVKDCFHYVNLKTELLCDRHEPITKQMCTRINNVYVLTEYLDVYHKKLKQSFEVQQDKLPQEKRRIIISTPTEETDDNEHEFVQSYEYDVDQDKSVTMETSSQKSSSDTSVASKSLILQGPADTCQRHLMKVLRAQCRIMAFRINLFVRDAIRVLLAFKNINTPIGVCLRPLTQFLQSYIDSFYRWLYIDCYRRLLECLWIYIVQDFEEELSRLKQSDMRVEERSKLLIQTLSHLIQFMNNQDKGLGRTILLSQAEEVMFKLQLYATPTPQLIILFKSLQDYYCESDTTTIHSIDDVVQTLMYRMRDDLQQYRKCFSGAQLVKWIAQNLDLLVWFDRENQVKNSHSRREKCVAIAEQLLYRGLIIDIDDEMSHNECFDENSLLSSLDEYPELIIHENLVSTSEMSENENTPRGSPIEHDKKKYSTRDNVAVLPNRTQTPRNTPFMKNILRSTPVNRSITPIFGSKMNFSSSSGKYVKMHSEHTGSLRKLNSSDQSVQRPSSVNIEKQKPFSQGLIGKRPSSVNIEKQKHSDTSVDSQHSGTSSVHINQENSAVFMDSSRPPSVASSYLFSTMNYMGNSMTFEDSHSKFYHIASFAETSIHAKPSSFHSNRDAQEINALVDECFQKKIMPDFILSILYMRKKYDLDSRIFLLRQPELVIEKIQHDIDNPRNTCDIS